MPAKRPQGDALAIWLVVELLRKKPGGTQDAAFTEIRDLLARFPFRKRGQNPCIDIEVGNVVGDKLSIDRAEGLYKAAQSLLRADPLLEREMQSRLSYLNVRVAEKPGSYLVPVRNKDWGWMEWVIAQYWPDGPLEERLSLHFPHEPPPLLVVSADTPDGPFD